MKNLISMTDFVLKKEKKWNYESTGLENTFRKYKDVVLIINNYANLLKQPLELWMFVPCDENGNVLEEPKRNEQDTWLWSEYQQAKERCLFEGIKGYRLCNNGFYIYYNKDLMVFLCEKDTIESVVDCNLQLTPTALKQIGL